MWQAGPRVPGSCKSSHSFHRLECTFIPLMLVPAKLCSWHEWGRKWWSRGHRNRWHPTQLGLDSIQWVVVVMRNYRHCIGARRRRWRFESDQVRLVCCWVCTEPLRYDQEGLITNPLLGKGAGIHVTRVDSTVNWIPLIIVVQNLALDGPAHCSSCPHPKMEMGSPGRGVIFRNSRTPDRPLTTY